MKKLILAMLSALCLTCSAILWGCGGNGPAFLEGALDTIYITDTLMLDEYIEYYDDCDEYTITLTKEGVDDVDLTNASFWIPSDLGELGDFVIVYKVKGGEHKGTSKFTLTVKAPALYCEYTLPDIIYEKGENLVFDDYFDDMNFFVDSYFPWSIVMDSVTVDGVSKTFSAEEEQYLISSMSDHTFYFHVQTEDGQTENIKHVVKVKDVDKAYLKELNDKDIYTYGEIKLYKDEIRLKSGSYKSTAGYPRPDSGPHDLPYIAFDGEYGLNDYVIFEFTGDNMPMVSFFRDEYSKSVFDSSKGILISNGFTKNSGAVYSETMCKRITVYGPNMVYMVDEDDKANKAGRRLYTLSSGSDAYPGSMLSLKDGVKYRLITGFTAGDTKTASFDLYLVNVDEGEVILNVKVTTQDCTADAWGGYSFSDGYFNGSIVAYGRYGKETKLDKIYEVKEDTSLNAILTEMFPKSEFKESAPTSIAKGESYNVGDFVKVDGIPYTFKYKKPNGEVVKVEGTSVSFDTVGTYTLMYSDGTRETATKQVLVHHYDSTAYSTLTGYGAKLSDIVTLESDYSVTFNKGSYTGTSPASKATAGESSLAYLAYDKEGGYTFGDYVVADFTGDNMPRFAFFANNYNNSIYQDGTTKTGVVISNGINYAGGSHVNSGDQRYKKITMYGPWFVNRFENNSGLKYSGTNTDSYEITANSINNGSMEYLGNNKDTHYRVITGFSSLTNGCLKLRYILINLDANEIVEDTTIGTYGFFTSGSFNGMFQSADDFKGSIVLYGRYDKELKLDKVYAIKENTTADAILAEMKATFKSGIESTVKVNTTLNVTDYIEKTAGYTLKLKNSAGTITDITGDTFTLTEVGEYTLIYNNGIAPIEGTLTLNAVNLASYLDKAHNVSQSGESVILNKGSYSGNPVKVSAVTNADLSYFAYDKDGGYGLGDYFVADFTGNNMPWLAFFANNYNQSIYQDLTDKTSKTGVVVSNGAKNSKGNTLSGGDEINKTISLYGPYFVNDFVNTGNNSTLQTDSIKLTNTSTSAGNINSLLASTTKYRVIMGFSEVTTSGVLKLRYVLINLDTNKVIEDTSVTTYGFFGSTSKYFGSTTESVYVKNANAFKGSIVAYGRYDKDIVLDKVYDVKTSSQIEELIPVDVVLKDLNIDKVHNVSNTDEAVTLKQGSYSGSSPNNATEAGTADLSYFAYDKDGGYGIGDYFVADFTGDNMPRLAFFANNYNQSIYQDGTNKTGVVVSNALVTSGGTDIVNDSAKPDQNRSKKVSLYGPWMVKQFKDNTGFQGQYSSSYTNSYELTAGTYYNGSKNYLEENSTTHYRAIVGFSSLTNKCLKLRYVLYNLDTKKVEVDQTVGTYGFFDGSSLGGLFSTEAACKGSIVVYGRYDKNIVLDKVYDVKTSAEIDDLMPVDLSKNNIDKTHNVSESDGVVTLKQGSYTGNPVKVSTVTNADLSYFAYDKDGGYGLGDYFVADFTGDNMPRVAFFANNYNENIYQDGTNKTGVVVSNAIQYASGDGYSAGNAWYEKISMFGPYFVASFGKNDGLVWNNGTDSYRINGKEETAGSRTYLTTGANANTKYRVMFGFTKSGAVLNLHYVLINLDTKTEVVNTTINTYGYFTSTGWKGAFAQDDAFKGSIVAYGRYDKDIVLDKVYDIQENTTVEDIMLKLGSYTATTTEQFEFFAYQPPYDTGTTDFRTTEQYKLYKDCGLDILMLSGTAEVNGGTESQTNALAIMDKAYAAGIDKIIIKDARIYNKLYALTQEEREQKISALLSMSETELDSEISGYLAAYKNHSAFYGVMLLDEPSYVLAKAYGKLYKSIKRVMPECYVYYNFLPASQDALAAYPELDEGFEGSDEEKLLARYKKYIEAFIDEMGCDHIQYDDYPMGTAGISKYFIPCLQICAEIAKEKGIDLCVTTQTFNMTVSNVTQKRNLTATDAAYLNNILLGYGVKQISYFTYFTKPANDTETFIDGQSFVNTNGEKTEIYTFMQTIMAQNQAFAPYILNFDYNASKTCGTSTATHLSLFEDSTTAFTALSEYSTSKDCALITELVDADNGYYMYMAMNLTDTLSASETDKQTITLTFGEQYTHVMVFRNGVLTYQALDENNAVSIEALAGEASFVIPY